MAAASFPLYWPRYLRYEGTKLSTDKTDPGNWTGGKVGSGQFKGSRYGISAASYPNLDIGAITEAQAEKIIHDDYDAKVQFDDLNPGVDTIVIDPAVNNGVTRAAKFLQAAAKVPVNGRIDAATVEAANAQDGETVIKAVAAARLAFDRSLKLWAIDGKGWSARIADNEAFSLKLWLARGKKLPPAEVDNKLQEESAAAKSKAQANTVGAGGTAVTGGTVADQVHGLHGLPLAALIFVIVLGVALFIWYAFIHRQRAVAFQNVAREPAIPPEPAAPVAPPKPPVAA